MLLNLQLLCTADSDLDGEALLFAGQYGPDTSKEAIPSLGKCLGLLATIEDNVYIFFHRQSS